MKVYLTSITATLGPCKTSKSSPDTKEMEEQFAIAPLFLFSSWIPSSRSPSSSKLLERFLGEFQVCDPAKIFLASKFCYLLNFQPHP